MSISIQLVRKGWHHSQNNGATAHVRGQAHIGDEFLNTAALAERFLAQKTVADLDRLVSSLNGTWAAVVEKDGEVYLATDHIRSFQVFFSMQPEGRVIFDDVNEFRKTHVLRLDEDSVHEYLSCGNVCSNRTIYQGVYSLQAAEIVKLSEKDEPRASRYWKFFPVLKSKQRPDEDLFRRVDAVFLKMINRLVESIDGRKIAIPLSGGYDSRTLVSYLHRIGYKNVLCYSYGRSADEGQAAVSQDIAKRLEYEWHFLKTDTPRWCDAINCDSMRDYLLYASNGVNCPFFQEYFPLETMLKDGTLKGNEVIVPGYSLDFPAGSCIMKRVNDWNFVSELVGFGRSQLQLGEWFRSYGSIGKLYKENQELVGTQFYETYLWQEESVKRICNSIRQFEWLGFDWRLPEWDLDVLNLWLSLPEDLRYARKYFISIFDRLAEPEIRGIPVFKEMSGLRAWKNTISTHVPFAFTTALQRLMGRGRYAKIASAGQGINIRQAIQEMAYSEKTIESVRMRLQRNFNDDLRDIEYLPSSNMAIALRTLGLMME